MRFGGCAGTHRLCLLLPTPVPLLLDSAQRPPELDDRDSLSPQPDTCALDPSPVLKCAFLGRRRNHTGESGDYQLLKCLETKKHLIRTPPPPDTAQGRTLGTRVLGAMSLGNTSPTPFSSPLVELLNYDWLRVWGKTVHHCSGS